MTTVEIQTLKFERNALTCQRYELVVDLEAGILDALVRFEAKPEKPIGTADLVGEVVPAKRGEQVAVAEFAVSDLQLIVFAARRFCAIEGCRKGLKLLERRSWKGWKKELENVL